MACFDLLRDGDPLAIALAAFGGLLLLLSLMALIHTRGLKARERALGWSAALLVGSVLLGLAVFALDLRNLEMVRTAVGLVAAAHRLEIVLSGYNFSVFAIMIGWLAMLAPLSVGLFLFVRGAMGTGAEDGPADRQVSGRTVWLATGLIAVGLSLGAWALIDYLRFGDVLLAVSMAI